MNNETHLLGIYSYYDSKSKAWDVPFIAQHDVNAKRKFIMDARGNGVINQFTEEFTLYKLGTFDMQLGIFNITRDEKGAVETILTGKEVIAALKKEDE